MVGLPTGLHSLQLITKDANLAASHETVRVRGKSIVTNILSHCLGQVVYNSLPIFLRYCSIEKLLLSGEIPFDSQQ